MTESKELALARFVKTIMENFYVLVSIIGLEQVTQIFGKEFYLMSGQYEYKVRNLSRSDDKLSIKFEYTKAGSGNGWDRMNLTAESSWQVKKITVEQVDLIAMCLGESMNIGLKWLASITAKQKDKRVNASTTMLKLEDELRKIKAEELIKTLKELKTSEAIEELMNYL